jgi:hypothetical protein
LFIARFVMKSQYFHLPREAASKDKDVSISEG